MAMRRNQRCSTVSFSTTELISSSEPLTSCVRSNRRRKTEPAGDFKKLVSLEVEHVRVGQVNCMPNLLTSILGKKQATKFSAQSFGQERLRAAFAHEARSRTAFACEDNACRTRSEGSGRAPRGILRKPPSPGDGPDQSSPKPRSASRVRFSEFVTVADVQWAEMNGNAKQQVSCDAFEVESSSETNLVAELDYPNPEMAINAEADKIILSDKEWCDDISDAEESDCDFEEGGRAQRVALNRPRSRSYKDLEGLVNGMPVVAAM